MQEAHISCSDKETFGRAACRDFLMKTITACNKITDAGVCRDHSGSTRMLFQEANHWFHDTGVIELTALEI